MFTNGKIRACEGTDRRALYGLYDPDGVVSGSADSVYLFLYEDGDVRTLETLGTENTCIQGRDNQTAIANADPDYLDL